jgi:hypothetical protein
MEDRKIAEGEVANVAPEETEEGATPVPARPSKARLSKKGPARRKTTRLPAAPAAESRSRTARTVRAFPASSFGEAIILATAIWQYAAGERVRRLTLFDSLNKSPESGPSRQLVTNSGRYGLTTGSYASEYLELTPKGSIASNPESPPAERLRAQFELSIEGIPAFAALYENYRGKKLPGHAVVRDFLKEHGVPDANTQECLDTFVVNSKQLGMLRTIGGAERIVSIEQLIEETQRGATPEPAAASAPGLTAPATAPSRGRAPGATARPASEWSSLCFYVTPIGREGSEERMHSDLFLSAIVEPAVTEFDLHVVRADQIGKPGMITAQIIEHLVKARLVIADLSFHNPNVFYEVATRVRS